MARSFSIPSQTFAPGTYGPFAVDSLTNANTKYLELVVTQDPGNPWPDQPLVVRATLTWDDGSSAPFDLAGYWRNRDGTRRYSVPLRLSPPSRAVTDGTLTFEVFATIKAAASLTAVAV